MNIDEFKGWQQKYIALAADISNNLTEMELAKECDVQRNTIWEWKKRCPELHTIIFERMKLQTDSIGHKSLIGLNRMLSIKNINPAILKMGLEVSGQIKNSIDITNRYETMDKPNVIKEIKNSFSKIMKENNVNTTD